MDAFLLGPFFGIIILPCNAAAVVALLAIGTTHSGFLANLGSFFAFGMGMSLPLLAFAALSLPEQGGPVMVLQKPQGGSCRGRSGDVCGFRLLPPIRIVSPGGRERGRCLAGRV